MTVEELLAKKEELVELKRQMIMLCREGNGEELELLLIEEELLCVNAQLRARKPPRRVDTRFASQIALDRQQFIDWEQKNNSFDDLIEEGWKASCEAAVKSLDALTPRQREILKLSVQGMKNQEIAVRLGINRSSVSRTLSRGKARAAKNVERILLAQRSLKDGRKLDMTDEKIVRTIISELTPTQVAYMYLYYAKFLYLREIAELVGVCAPTVLRTIQRAERKINWAVGESMSVFVKLNTLEELACQAYLEIRDRLDIELVDKIESRCAQNGNRRKSKPRQSERLERI